MFLSTLSRILSSPRSGTVLMLVWALLLVVWVVPFQFYGLPQEQVRAIVRSEYFFVIVYVALVVTTVACLIPRFRSIVSRARHIPASDAHPSMTAGVLLEETWDAEKAVAVLRKSGYRRVAVGEGWAWGVKRRFSPLGSLAFHGSFLVLAAAVLVAHYIPSFSGSVVVSEGETFSGARARYEDVRKQPPSGPPPRVSFKVDAIEPRFHDDVLLFTRLDSRLRTAGGVETVRVGAPWFPSPTTVVRIEDFGYSLEVEDRFAAGTPRQSVYRLHAFPSGQSDSFQYDSDAPGSNDKYIVTIAVYGDYRPSRDSAPGVASFNLSNPRLLVSIQRLLSNGERRSLVDRRLVRPGTVFDLPSGPLKIVGVSEWGRFRVTDDPAMPVFLLAVLIGTGGVVTRMAFPRVEALLLSGPDGIGVGVRRDAYGSSVRLAARIGAVWKGSR